MSRLSDATLASLPTAVQRPSYDRSKLRASIVHLGPGAFHRAHQAPVFDALNARVPRWGITGVSLHSRDVRDALAPQDGLYTLALLDAEPRYQILGAVKEIVVAPENPEAVLARLAAPETEIVTLTITEKGYWPAPDGGINVEHPDYKADAANPEQPRSALGYLVAALRRRKAAGLKPFVLLSCDNLTGNGARLSSSLWVLARAQARATDPRRWDLSSWISDELVSPPTMVDSITPATDDALRARVEAALGVRDAWPVQREPFTQWVISRDPRLPDIGWEEAGVTLGGDVAGFERAKLRILNATHSALAYLGSLRGHETVADAMADPELAAFARALMDDLGRSLSPSFDIEPYKHAVLARFRNPAVRHLLSQIAWDGSQKLPNRLLPYIQEALTAGWPIANAARVIAAWFQFLRRRARDGDKLVDPLAPLLLAAARRSTGEAAHDVALFLELREVFLPALAAQEAFKGSLTEAYAQLGR